jgi:hypothetical protein
MDLSIFWLPTENLMWNIGDLGLRTSNLAIENPKKEMICCQFQNFFCHGVKFCHERKH